jgi:hypothetical protein
LHPLEDSLVTHFQHQDMQRQLSLAQVMVSTQSKEDPPNDGANLRLAAASQSAGLSPELSHHLRTYIQNDDAPNVDEKTETGIAHHVALHVGMDQEANPMPAVGSAWDMQTGAAARVYDQGYFGGEPLPTGPGVVDFFGGALLPVTASSMWWNQDPGSLPEVFGSGIHPQVHYEYHAGTM